MDAILFDLDETLCDRTACIAKTAHIVAQSIAGRFGRISSDLFERAFLRADLENESKVDFATSLLVQFDEIGLTASELIQWRDNVALSSLALFPDAIETIKSLKKLGLLLGIISNASRWDYQYSKIVKLGLEDYMDTIVISDKNLKKPEPEIFLSALRDLGVDPSRSIFVGDNPITDIEGAHRVGMKTIYKCNGRFGFGCELADHYIRELRELTPLVL